jgi:hypothetical protein
MRVMLRGSLAVVLAGMGMAVAQTTTPAVPQVSPQQREQEIADFYKTHYAKHEYRVGMRELWELQQ